MKLSDIGINGRVKVLEATSLTAAQKDHVTSLQAVSTGRRIIKTATGVEGVLDNTSAAVNPTVTNDSSEGYSNQSLWFNTTASPPEAFRCVDASVGAAVWVKTTLTLDELGSAATANLTTANTQTAPGLAADASHVAMLGADNTLTGLNTFTQLITSNPAPNSQTLKFSTRGHIGSIGGGYPVLSSNAYTFGNPFDFKNSTASANVGMGVVSPMRDYGPATIGGVYTHPGNATADVTVAWSAMNKALSWDTAGKVGCGGNPGTAQFAVTGAISATTGITPATGQDAITAWNDYEPYTVVMTGSGGSIGSFAVNSAQGEFRIHDGEMHVNIAIANITDLGSWTGDVRFSLPQAPSVATGNARRIGPVYLRYPMFVGSPIVRVDGTNSYAAIVISEPGGPGAVLQWTDLSLATNNLIQLSLSYPI